MTAGSLLYGRLQALECDSLWGREIGTAWAGSASVSAYAETWDYKPDPCEKCGLSTYVRKNDLNKPGLKHTQWRLMGISVDAPPVPGNTAAPILLPHRARFTDKRRPNGPLRGVAPPNRRANL
jgi:hypothetical protein